MTVVIHVAKRRGDFFIEMYVEIVMFTNLKNKIPSIFFLRARNFVKKYYVSVTQMTW